ncbi:AAA family ATPase [Niabella aquatica]
MSTKQSAGKDLTEGLPQIYKNGNKRSAPVTDTKKFTGESELDEKKLEEFEDWRVTTEKVYPNNEPVMTWEGAGIGAAGNITGISAQSKAGKTSFINSLIAGAISRTGIVEMLGKIKVAPNPLGKGVPYFDTEQTESDQQNNIRTAQKRAGLVSTPDYLHAYNVRKLTIENYQPITDAICEAVNQRFNGIHSIFIDGGADYITSVNDEEQAYRIVEYFTQLAIKYHCPVIVVVHQNPGSDKERGHFGSQLQRKCYGLISIEKKDEISVAKPKIMRKASVGDLQPIYFKYDKEKGYHIEVNAPITVSTSQKKLLEIEGIVRAALTGQEPLGHNDTIDKIMAVGGMSDRTAKNYLKTGVLNNWVEHGSDGKYRVGVGRGN